VNPSAVLTNTGTAPRTVTVRLTATDTNADNVGPESATKTMVITVQGVGAAQPSPPPPATDTTPPKVALTLARSLTVRSKLRLSFTTDEAATATASLKVARKTAKATKGFAAAGRHTLTIRLSKKIRRLLRHRRKVTLTLTVADGSGKRTAAAAGPHGLRLFHLSEHL